jgi:hypothetical protein
MDSSLLERLEAIRAQRPWAANPVYRSILDGTYSRTQVAVWAGQWRWHMFTAPTFFAGVFAQTPVGNPVRWRVLANLGNVRAGEDVNVRRRNEQLLARLQAELAGADEVELESIPKLPETIAHLGLMRDLTWNRSAAEGAAAILALKPGFSPLCASLAEALRSRFSVSDAGTEFFDRMAARGDEGEVEIDLILSESGGRDSWPEVETAFRDGLCSYHLILDGCHRAAGGTVDPAASRPILLPPDPVSPG